MRDVVQVNEAFKQVFQSTRAPELYRAIALLNEAIALLDDVRPGNSGLSLAAAHTETALFLVESEFDADVQD